MEKSEKSQAQPEVGDTAAAVEGTEAEQVAAPPSVSSEALVAEATASQEATPVKDFAGKASTGSMATAEGTGAGAEATAAEPEQQQVAVGQQPSVESHPPSASTSVPSQQGVFLHKSEVAAPAVTSAPTQPELASAPSTQAVIAGPAVNNEPVLQQGSTAARSQPSSADRRLRPQDPTTAIQQAPSLASEADTGVVAALDTTRPAAHDQPSQAASSLHPGAVHVGGAAGTVRPSSPAPDVIMHPSQACRACRQQMGPLMAVACLAAAAENRAGPDHVARPVRILMQVGFLSFSNVVSRFQASKKLIVCSAMLHAERKHVKPGSLLVSYSSQQMLPAGS